MFLIHAIVATLCCLLGVIILKDKPEQPISYSATQERLNFKNTLTRICKNKSVLSVTMVVNFINASNLVLSVTIERAFRDFGVTTLAMQPYSIAATVIVLFIGIILSFLAGKFGKFKNLIILMALFCLIFYILLLALHKSYSPAIFGITLIVSILTDLVGLSLGLEFSADSLYPAGR